MPGVIHSEALYDDRKDAGEQCFDFLANTYIKDTSVGHFCTSPAAYGTALRQSHPEDKR